MCRVPEVSRLAFPPAVRTLAGLWAGLVDLVTSLALLGLGVAAWAPSQDLPWTPLRLGEPLSWATDLKFAAALRDPQRCRAVLREGGVSFSEAPSRRDGDCTVRNALRPGGGAVPLSPAAPVMTCAEALGYAFWTRHVVQPAAREHLGREVARIDHYGTYACRDIRGGHMMSQHASANALDVAGFRLQGGARVSVRGDFRRDDRRGRFLRQSRDGACRWFRAVLSPDYDAAHADHLHLDQGFWGKCQ